MLAYTIRRIAISIPILLIATFVTFWMVAVSADPLQQLEAKGRVVPPAVIAQYTARLHLDQPIVTRYVAWLRDVVLHGYFGPSVTGGVDIGAELGRAFLVTLRLVLAAMVLAVLLAVVAGVISAVRQYSRTDYAITLVGFLALSLPVFLFALLLKQLAINVNEATGSTFLQTIGEATPDVSGGVWAQLRDELGHLILPTIVLALASFASWSRFQRASMLEVLHSDYVRLARAKGLRRRTVLVRHALRTALIPFVTIVAIDVAGLLGGAIVTERVFQWNGMGTLLVTAISNQDVYAVAGWLLLSSVLVIVFNLLADLAYAVLDPRIRYA